MGPVRQAGMIRRDTYHLPQSGRARVEVFARLWYLLAVDAYLALDGMTEAGYSADAALETLEEIYRPWLTTSLDDAIDFGKQWWLLTRSGLSPEQAA